jgi:hypothetical protein
MSLAQFLTPQVWKQVHHAWRRVAAGADGLALDGAAHL